MLVIHIERNPPEDKLNELGVYDWDVWQKGESEFTWTYYIEETCYLLEGEVTVTPDDGEPVQFGAGDMVVFPADLSCTWKITKPVKKHYTLA